MQLIEAGLLSQSQVGTDRAILTFPALTVLADSTLIAAWRSGSSKDSADETIEMARSSDSGRTWSRPQRPFAPVTLAGKQGSLKVCYLTEVSPGRLLAAAMWIDRQSYPDQPLFNAETEGCLPMAILLAESSDGGQHWGSWRQLPMPAEIGPPSLTNPILKLADGTLAMSIETNKRYHDAGRWYQRVVLFHSRDGGQSWGEPVIAGCDPTGRIYNWDQRVGVAPDGRIAAFLWTYDSETKRYLNIHRRLSSDGGQSWSQAVDLGFPDQAAHPAILPDGRVVLAWVDRFQTHSIRARLAPAIDGAFAPQSEVVLYTLGQGRASVEGDETGALLAEMALWTFGLPYAEALPDGTVLVTYYAGTAQSMDLHWARLQLPPA